MSSFRRRCAFIAVVLGWAAPLAHAQTVAEQREHIASLTARLRTLNAALDSVRRRVDTIEVEGIRVALRPEARSRAGTVVRAALAELERRLGPTDRRLLDGWVVIRRGAAWTDPQPAIDDLLRAAGDERLSDLGGSALRVWADWWRSSEEDLQGAYLDLVTSPTVAATHCFEGSIRSCVDILGLDTVANLWRDLFDAAGRRVWVSRRLNYLRSARAPRLAEPARLFRECTNQQSDDACLALLHTTGTPIPDLVSRRTKRSLVFVARSLGGDGTFTRLVADTTGLIGHRLSAAANVPLDSLLHVWHARVLEAEPPSTRVGPVAAWTSLLVVVLAGLFSLRSTRWRLA
jgi:hypothetical protein